MAAVGPRSVRCEPRDRVPTPWIACAWYLEDLLLGRGPGRRTAVSPSGHGRQAPSWGRRAASSMPSTESVIVKESGFDLGFAVLIDAFVIRNLPVSASPRPPSGGPTQGRTSTRGDTMGFYE